MDRSHSNKKPQGSQHLGEPVFLPCAVALKEVADAYAEASIVKHPDQHYFLSRIRADAIDAMLRRLATGTLLARCEQYELFCDQGYVPFADKSGIIPKDFWAYVRRFRMPEHQDWLSGDFTVECLQDRQYVAGYAHAVRFERAGLPLVNEPSAISQAITATRGGPGAPRRWDWDGALAHLAALAHFSADGLHRADGTEPNQSDIARQLGDWFIGNGGECPENSQLRTYGKRVVQEINTLKLLAANNRQVA
ncbi:hypothetical protein U4960_02740 [Altererythrobacter sp. H2]|uniref:hypothetical protein n=1 Tax=Altererythrobacter sp. H2 TaxID=3108391 RepID=UPI002B4BF00D|nr:hypothetical protein [Altererythrobacter sp. H2]WRK96267.1 hypothetical protein U4960_02740 [Altererythrobacter sp. H2]